MTQKERQARSKAEILRAAAEEFGTYGYHDVTMESICTRHGISKGMMYHYYSKKDELFLPCVAAMLEQLKNYVEQHMDAPTEESSFQTIQKYFLLRDAFFREHPLQRRIFEDAVFHPPQALAEEIHRLRAPLRAINHRFLTQAVCSMSLRPSLHPEKVARYLECLDAFFWSFLAQYQPPDQPHNLQSMLTSTEEILDMILYGLVSSPPLPQTPSCPQSLSGLPDTAFDTALR